MPRRFAALLAALLALAPACTPARAPAPATPPAIRVLVLNIFAGKDTARVSNLERVATLVRETGADVVLMQEVDRLTRRSGNVDQPAVLASLTGYHARFGRTIDWDGGEFGLMLLSRWPVVGDSMIHYAVTHPEGSTGANHEARGMLVASLATPWGPMRVANTHLSASGGDHYRLQEVSALAREVARLRSDDVPVLVGGDFNARPQSEVIRGALAQGWRDAWTECGDGGPGDTFPVRVPDRRIDYLFLVNGVGCASAHVVGHGVSDHLGVLVTVTRARDR